MLCNNSAIVYMHIIIQSPHELNLVGEEFITSSTLHTSLSNRLIYDFGCAVDLRLARWIFLSEGSLSTDVFAFPEGQPNKSAHSAHPNPLAFGIIQSPPASIFVRAFDNLLTK